MREVVVVDAVRSPIGRRNGSLARKLSAELLGDVLVGLFRRNDIDPSAVDQVLGGCVTQVGAQASNVVRNAWLGAGLPMEVPATTVNALCGSSQQSVTLAHGLLAGGLADVVVACGVEVMSMVPSASNVPEHSAYGLPRAGRYAELWEPTTQFQGAERIAQRWGFDRATIDAFGKGSQDCAARAWDEGRFDSQIIPVEVSVTDGGGVVVGTTTFRRDEGTRSTTLEGLAKLRPNVSEPVLGVHTAGTSSQVSDGASAALLMTAEWAERLGRRPRARLVTSAVVGSDPVLMLTGPIPATARLLARSGLRLDQIDLFEINEAFASVVLAWLASTGADPDRCNVNGGAIALGHPLGATGTMLLAKIISELERSGGRYGLISMCCGGGLGTGTIVERI
jgi:acetyl-CoA C-acetyltransferase